MKIFPVMLLLLMGCFSAPAQADLTRRCVSRFENKQYELVVVQSDLDAAPLWSEDQPNPPLSMRAAITSAREVAKKVPNSDDWRVSKIILEESGNKAGQWIYVVEFTTFYKDTVLLGPGHTFQVPVLLNGKTPELKVK
jgi:hypothetical protein